VIPDIDVQPSLLRLPCDDIPVVALMTAPPTSCGTFVVDAGVERTECPDIPPSRDVLDDFPVDDLLQGRVLHVHDGRFARDRQRFLERPNTKFLVDRRGELPVSPIPFTLERVEAGEREGHRVSAGRQVDDLILPGSVGNHRADLLDQRGTGGLDRDACNTAPDASFTTPAIEPCAEAMVGIKAAMPATR